MRRKDQRQQKAVATGDLLLDDRLRATLRSMRWASRAQRIGRALWPAPIVAAALLAIDAGTPMTGDVRAALALLWLLVVSRAMLGLLPDRSTRRAGLSAAARLIEERLDLEDNAIVNAVQLRSQMADAPESSFDAALMRRAVAQGVRAIETIGVRRIVDMRPARSQWSRVAGALAAFGMLSLLAPRFVKTQTLRFADPFGDHPPFSMTEFVIETTPRAPDVGDDVMIRATTRGRQPDQLAVVTLDGDGRRSGRRAMTLAGESVGKNEPPQRCWELHWREIREPIRIYVDGPTGRSAVQTIEPINRPKLLAATLRIIPPAYMDKPDLSRDVKTGAWAPVTAMVGSTAELSVVTSPPVERAEATGAGDVRIEADRVLVRYSLDAPGVQTLSVLPYAVSGVALKSQVRVDVRVVEDRAPEIVLIAPSASGEERYAPAGSIVHVRVAASDDVLLESFQMEVSFPQSEADAIRRSQIVASMLGEHEPGRSEATASAALDIKALGLGAGDALAIRFIARDNRPDELGGPQQTSTRSVVLHIVDAEQYAKLRADQRARDAFTADSIDGGLKASADSEAAGDGRSAELDRSDSAGVEADAGGDAKRDRNGDQAEARSAAHKDGGAGMSGPNQGVTVITDADRAASNDRRVSFTDPIAAQRAVQMTFGQMANPAAPDSLSQVSPAYRDLASDYFLALARVLATDSEPKKESRDDKR